VAHSAGPFSREWALTVPGPARVAFPAEHDSFETAHAVDPASRDAGLDDHASQATLAAVLALCRLRLTRT